MNTKIFKKIVTSVATTATFMNGISLAHDQTGNTCSGHDCCCSSDENRITDDQINYLKSVVQTVMDRWDSVKESFKFAKIDSRANLEKLGFGNLDKLERCSDYYLTYINDFLNKNDDIAGIDIDGVIIRRNDKKSEEIKRNLIIFNLSKKFELIDNSISDFKYEYNYQNNSELIKCIRESLKNFGNSNNSLDVIDLSDDLCALGWKGVIFGYLSAVFNFCNDIKNIGNFSTEECKNILQTEFDIVNKSTSSDIFRSLNIAAEFMNNYANDVLDGKIPDLSKTIPIVEKQLKN